MSEVSVSKALLWAATIVSLLGFFAHAFLGTRMFARPLMAASDLPVEVIWLGYVSWHVVSIVLLSLSVAFGCAVMRPANRALAMFASAMSAAVSILCIAAGIFGNSVLLMLPAPYLFGLIAFLGIGGMLTMGGRG